MKPDVSIFWFRRDLRLDDNAGLYHALKSRKPVLPIFIFDRNILDQLENKEDRRVEFIYREVNDLRDRLKKLGSSLRVFYGNPEAVFRDLVNQYRIAGLFANHDYEPYARKRDESISEIFTAKGISFHTCKDQVIFDRDEILKDDGKPYTVFTPYSKKWKQKLSDFYLKSYPCSSFYSNFYRMEPQPLPTLTSMGFRPGGRDFPSTTMDETVIKKYDKLRDYPGVPGTTRLSMHLRFGTISIRELARKAVRLNEKYLNELIWRDFYQMILWHFPRVGEGHAFKPEYEEIPWRNNEKEFKKWCEGQTGYPIVDAGMRELNETGYMHNRVRMIVASFLTKHLLIDWRWGEAYFAEKLLDFDLASNNGGWQWAAGSGVDAAPYFRIFNPYIQTKKFDPDLAYVRKWVPEFEELSYPPPIVEHEFARKRCLEAYGNVLQKEKIKI